MDSTNHKSPKSQGRQCAAAGCTSRQYCFVNGERVATGINFFSFPLADKARVIQWCNLIRRRNNCDGFIVNNGTKVCDRHFPKESLYRPPGGSRVRLRGEQSKPILHSWNNFTNINDKKRKSPANRASSSTTTKINIESEQEQEVPEEQDDNFVDELELDFVIETCDPEANDNSSDDEVLIIKEDKGVAPADVTGDAQESETVQQLRSEVEALKISLKESEEREKDLSKKLNSNDLAIMDEVLSSDSLCNHYTGFPSISRMQAVFEFLDAGINGQNVILHQNQGNKGTGAGRPRSLPPFHCYVLTLIRLRRNFDIVHLAFLFHVNGTTVSMTFITWINFMYIRLGSVPIWPSMQHVGRFMPDSMRKKFPFVKVIIDCVEFRVESATSLFMHKLFYSDYKSHTTVKCLVAICPGGGFCFISSVFPGSISDKEITVRSGLLNPALWNPGEGIMADRGFTVKDYTDNLNIKLVIPAFLKGRDQLSEEEVVLSQQIASERIHVERMIQRLKTYHIFDRVIPISMMGSLNQIISVCALLSNFQDPIIAAKGN